MAREHKEIGLAIIGCGTIGRLRALVAMNYPAVKWIGICDKDTDKLNKLKTECKADFATTDYKELINRPEVNAVAIVTDENFHVEPTLEACDRGIKYLFIEKPLATDVKDSLRILNAIESANIDTAIGYTNRFRRRFLAVKERLTTGQIGNVHTVVTRAFMNRMVPIATIAKTTNVKNLTPMVVSGTHSFDMSLWLMEGKNPVSLYAQSNDKVLKKIGTKDSTFGIFTMNDGTIFSMNICWALPTIWPGAVYGIEIGIVGDKGVIDIEDTHRDLVLASEIPQPAGYRTNDYEPEMPRHVDFLTSYPPGDIQGGEIWGPVREETVSWFAHIATGLKTPHATAYNGHRNLVLTMGMDLSARTNSAIAFPADIRDMDLDIFYK